PPGPPPNGEVKNEDRRSKTEYRGSKIEDGSASAPAHVKLRSSIPDTQSSILDPQSSILPSSGDFAARLRPDAERLRQAEWQGRWRTGGDPRSGRARGFLRAYRKGSVLSWAGTIRAASYRQMPRGRSGQDDAVILRIEDLRGWPKRGPGGCLLLFVVDVSGSMAAWQRMRQTKSAILSLLRQAYERRDQIALLVFRGKGTELVLSPTRALRVARRAVERLPVGGTTPLALGLTEARRLICRQRRRQSRQ